MSGVNRARAAHIVEVCAPTPHPPRGHHSAAVAGHSHLWPLGWSRVGEVWCGVVGRLASRLSQSWVKMGKSAGKISRMGARGSSCSQAQDAKGDWLLAVKLASSHDDRFLIGERSV
jgi:hypothetical protein